VLQAGFEVNFRELPLKFAKVLEDSFNYLKENVPPFLKEVIWPKLVEIGKNVGTVISEVFSELLTSLIDKIPVVGKVRGFIKAISSPAKKDGQTVMPVDPRYANAISAASRINKEDSLETGEEILEVKEDDKKTKGFLSALFSSDKEEAADESFEVAAKNITGAEMELGMSNIADAKSQPAPVIVSGGSSPQSTVINNTTTTYNGSDHVDESYILTRPLTIMAYGF
jgi:hypothetical protein